MCRSFLFIAVIFETAFVISGSSYCEKLHETYKGRERHVHIEGNNVEVEVIGHGGSARAAAAILVAAVKHMLRYSAHLTIKMADICELSKPSYQKNIVILSPAVTFTDKGCGPGVRSIDNIASLSRPAAVDISSQIMVRVPQNNNCTFEPSWAFLGNKTALRNCGFFETAEKESAFENSDTCKQFECIIVIARNESEHDQRIIQELQKLLISENLDHFKFITYTTDANFHREVFRRRSSNDSFMFIDENLWSSEEDIMNLELPSCLNVNKTCLQKVLQTSSVLVGDGVIVKYYAPPIYKLVNNFFPKQEAIKNILNKESSSAVENIEDGACMWALENKEDFENFIPKKEVTRPPAYNITIYLCNGDPYNDYYNKVIEYVGYKLYKDLKKEILYEIFNPKINCTDPNILKWYIEYLFKYKNVVAGAVTWSFIEGLGSATDVARRADIPLMIAGPAKNSILGASVYATSGRISDLARGYRHLLSTCSWKRIAIISDNTSYSATFANAILNDGVFNSFQVVVNKGSLEVELQRLFSRDARIVILNTSCKLSEAILFVAKTIFTSWESTVWIVRDWCLNNTYDIRNTSVYTIELSWRGESFSSNLNLTGKWAPFLKGNYMKEQSTISPGVSQLADALLILGYGFAEYRRARQYDLHGRGSTRYFDKSMSKINVTSFTQLNIKDHSIHKPLIYVNKWNGRKRRTMAIWQCLNNSIIEIWVGNTDLDACTALLDENRVPDQKQCLVWSGDAFSPHCHDVGTFILPVLVILICIAIYIAQKKRKDRLKAERKELISNLLEHRQKHASALTDYLVERGRVKLLHEIGSGCYGRVHFAELTRPGGKTLVVAAKKPHEGIPSQLEENEILREACVLARLEHNNVIRLVGVCLTGGPPIVLMEHASYLDLKRYLTERRYLVVNALPDDIHYEVSEERLTQLAYDAACALEYLAEQRLVHRDIRASNCLLNNKRSLKLADFGLARELDEEDSMYTTCRRTLFPVLWMAPESLAKGVFSLASDMWAMGVLMLEIATMGSRPYGDWPKQSVMKYVIQGGRPPLPPDTSLQMRRLLLRCWCRDPNYRITAQNLRQHIQENPKLVSASLLAPVPPLTPVKYETRIRHLT